MEEFPSIYIEGAAASGKTTAVRLLLRKNPDMKAYILEMKEEAEAIKKLDEIEAVEDAYDTHKRCRLRQIQHILS